MSAPTLAPVGPRRRQLTLAERSVRGDITISVDPDFTPAQCDHCGYVDAWTTVRVYGQPAGDVEHPVERPEVCADCAPDVIDEALAQQCVFSRKPIHVEIAVAPEVAALPKQAAA